MVHPLANVHSKKIGSTTSVWQYAVILDGATIGDNCNINCHTFIEGGVKIGNNVTVKSGVYLWDGVIVKDDVFIGPNATFINDKTPRSKKHLSHYQGAVLEKGVSIGANATIMSNINIGSYALIGAGSLVLKDVPPHALMVGSPAKCVGWVDVEGNRLIQDDNNSSIFVSEKLKKTYELTSWGLKEI